MRLQHGIGKGDDVWGEQLEILRHDRVGPAGALGEDAELQQVEVIGVTRAYHGHRSRAAASSAARLQLRLIRLPGQQCSVLLRQLNRGSVEQSLVFQPVRLYHQLPWELLCRDLG